MSDPIPTPAPSLSLALAQQERAAWGACTFPCMTADQTLLGLMEELGELAVATTDAERIDAIGDLTIFAVAHANMLGINLEDWRPTDCLWWESLAIPRDVMANCAFRDIAGDVGKIAHSRLKRAQNTKMNEDHDLNERKALGELVVSVGAYAETQFSLTIEQVLHRVWEKVKQRTYGKTPPPTPDLDMLSAAAGIDLSTGFNLVGLFGGDHPSKCTACERDLNEPGIICIKVDDGYICDDCHED